MPNKPEPEEAVKELFTLYADDIYRYARYVLQDSSEAEDVVQEVFLRAYRAWNTFRGDANPKTWLWSIMRHYIQDLFRKKSIEKKNRSYDDLDLAEVSVTLETLVELEEILGQLKVPLRQVFVLRCIEDLSVSETAHILGWSESKVKTTLHRAIKQLRMRLQVSSEAIARETGGDESRETGGIRERN